MAELLPPGTPTWVDLSTTDVDAGRRFYQELFGWTTDDPAGPEFGGYAMFRSNGKMVAGSGTVMGDGPPAWTTYVRSADAAATAQKVRDAGGDVVPEPMVIGDSGTMAIFRDPDGPVRRRRSSAGRGVCSVFQLGSRGASSVPAGCNEPVRMRYEVHA